MRNETRKLYASLQAHIAKLNGVSHATEQFDVNPSVEQQMEVKMQESVGFLNRINVSPVDQLKGEKLGLSVTSTIAGRSASGTRRTPRDVSGLDQHGYELKDTDFDVGLGWGKIDQWAKFPNFAKLYTDAVMTAIGLDRIRIGFNGTSAAAVTDRVAHPNLEDVNIGWLQKLRVEKPAHVLGDADSPIWIDPAAAGAAYKNIDALVYDLVSGMPSWARNDTDLVAIVGQNLVDDKYFPMINSSLLPTEQLARDVIMSTKQIGGKPAVIVPFFPDSTVAVTTLKNLSLYYQAGTRRRYLKDEAEYHRVADYQSSNEGYVIEDLDYMVMAEAITFEDPDA